MTTDLMTEPETKPMWQNPAAVLNALRQQEREIAVGDLAKWKELICDVADEKEVDIAAAQTLLARTGRTCDDLEKALKLLKERRTWANQIAAGEQAEIDIQRLGREIAELDSDFAKKQQEYEAAAVPLHHARQAAAAALSTSFNAKSRLIHTCTDPEALAMVAKLDQRMAELRHAMPELKGKADTKRLAMQSWIDVGDDGYASDIERVKLELAEMDAKYTAMQLEGEQINTDRAAAELQFLCVPEAI